MLYRFLFAPVGWVYMVLVRLRLWLYAANIRHTVRLQKPVVSVGNLTMGGTGKTPTVVALAHLLQSAGYRVSVILRGYKGRHRGKPLLVSDGKRVLASARVAGDEALVIAKNLPHRPVVVSKDRKGGGTWLENNFPVDLHLLDDGYQHLKLFRDFNLLLFDVTNPFGGGYPPLGRLREPLSGIQRADAILFTRTRPNKTYPELIKTVRTYRPDLPIFFSRQRIRAFEMISEVEPIPSEKLQKTSFLAFAGIGNPNQFFSLLQESRLNIQESCTFGDHHRYTSRDIMMLKALCQEKQADAIITTEKDLVNFDGRDFKPIPLLVARLEFVFDDPDGLCKLILNKIGLPFDIGVPSETKGE